MNVTEQFEEIYRLATLCPSTNTTPQSYPALVKFCRRVHEMRRKLDASRRHRARQRLQSDSYLQMRDELNRIGECDVCRWQFEFVNGIGVVNPLTRCTGEFGCAMECLRYKSCEWHPDILKPATSTRTAP